MHYRHLARRSFRSLVIIREILFDMTVRTGNAERPTVTEVHDSKEPSRGRILEPLDLNVLKNLHRGLIFSPRNFSRKVLHEAIIDLLIGVFMGCRSRSRLRIRR